MTDKTPIGEISFVGPDYYHVMIRLNEDKGTRHKAGDIITLDMIEPYESEAVRKVACHLYRMEYETDYVKFKDEEMNPVLLNLFLEDAREIVKLVHEAEDADE